MRYKDKIARAMAINAESIASANTAQLAEIIQQNGNTTLNTVAQNITGAINEVELSTSNNASAIATNTTAVNTNTTKIGNMGSFKTFKGTCLFASLPTTGMLANDYWYVSDQTTNYCYNGTAWINIGNNLSIGNNSITTAMRTDFGRYGFASIPLDYNTTTKMLTWGTGFIFGVGLSRISITGGSSDMTAIISNTIVYYDTVANTIVNFSPSSTFVANETYVCLGIIWVTNFNQSIMNCIFTINGGSHNTYGSYGFISNPLDYNTTTHILSWTSTYVFGINAVRISLATGSIDLTAYVSMSALLYFNTVTNTIVVLSGGSTVLSSYILLGLLDIADSTQNRLNFPLTINGLKQSTGNNISRYNGLKWDVMGDSITEHGFYQPIVQSLLNFNTINEYGISGTCLASLNVGDTTSMAYRIAGIDFTADLITVFGGTNDWGNVPAKPLGVMGDTVNTTVYGAINSIINTVLTNAPNKRLIFITPTQRDVETAIALEGWSETTQNALGYYLYDVVSAIIEVCARYGVPVLDLYHNSGITQANILQMTDDGLHPSALTGMVRIGNQMATFINNN